MSARFWLFSMVSAVAALAGGLGLGFYATTPPRAALMDYEDSAPFTGEEQDAPLWGSAGDGPTEVKCTGCGPTLAQRQMVSMMGDWNGYDDPVVRDYEAQDDSHPEDLLAEVADPPPSPVHRLPANVERFANGEDETPPPVALVQAGMIAPGSVAVIHP